jgi:hypothetical protein
MQEDLQSDERNTVFYLRNLLQIEHGYDENIWRLIAGKVHSHYDFRNILNLPIGKTIEIVENFVNEVRAEYQSSERDYACFCEDSQGYSAPTFYEYVRAHLSERPSEKGKSKQRLNPSAKTNTSCQAT